MKPKELLQAVFEKAEPPDFRAPDEPHGVLADLDLPIYITTNYDGLMLGALRDREKDPIRELCGWNELVRMASPSALDDGVVPTPARPLVYHLHGHSDVPQSMVLTEDDYLRSWSGSRRTTASRSSRRRSAARSPPPRSSSSATAWPTGTSACSSAG